ncbi:hypothetical protein [[Actinomadura] parvosata]|uniref:hypothetical protein n=1 Tax=[Actinomadura] parvosata TaxID=1955412 RepID=UPI001FE80A6F
MTDPADCSKINWSILDNALNEIASYGNQAAVRFYLEYPDGSGTHPANAIPRCFDGHVTYRTNTRWGTTSPDYDNAYLLDALSGFIAAFGARYDGDPRIGFIHLGLIGLWGEWHTWPYDTDTSGDSYPNYMPTDEHAARILRAYDDAFDQTKLEVRYPDSAGGAATGLDVGYHDDSFCFREGSPWPASRCRSRSAAPPGRSSSGRSPWAARTSGSPRRWAARSGPRSRPRRSRPGRAAQGRSTT